jgi:hypothetical protein
MTARGYTVGSRAFARVCIPFPELDGRRHRHTRPADIAHRLHTISYTASDSVTLTARHTHMMACNEKSLRQLQFRMGFANAEQFSFCAVDSVTKAAMGRHLKPAGTNHQTLKVQQISYTRASSGKNFANDR